MANETNKNNNSEKIEIKNFVDKDNIQKGEIKISTYSRTSNAPQGNLKPNPPKPPAEPTENNG